MNNNNCPLCGSKLNKGEIFCRVCGTKISNNNQVFNQTGLNQNDNYNINSFNQNSMNQNDNYNISSFNQNNMNQNNNSNISSFNQTGVNQRYSNRVNNSNFDDALVRAYIGKNADALLKGNFSVCTLFFGAIYVFYRKMWVLGLIWIGINVVSLLFLKSLSSIILLGITIYLAITFKKHYIKHAYEKVRKIKVENVNKSPNALIKLCSKKGGTTLVPVIIIIGICIVFFVAIFILIKAAIDNIKDRFDDFNYQENSSSDNGLVGNLDATIPNIFEEDTVSDESLRKYYLKDDYDDYCIINMTYYNTTYYEYYRNKSAKEFLEGYIDSYNYNGISNKRINNETWSFATVFDNYNNPTYYYAILKDQKMYKIEFRIFKDDDKMCSNAHNEVVNSFRFK